MATIYQEPRWGLLAVDAVDKEPVAAAERLRRVLTWSETRALRYVLEAIGHANEGVINSAVIADMAYVTRSVVTQALRLCEAAGVMVVASLGAKGTRVKVLDRAVLEEAVR